jgi:hypothetical protein
VEADTHTALLDTYILAFEQMSRGDSNVYLIYLVFYFASWREVGVHLLLAGGLEMLRCWEVRGLDGKGKRGWELS